MLTQDVGAGTQVKWAYRGAEIPRNAHSVSQDTFSQPRQGQSLHVTPYTLPLTHHGGGSFQEEAEASESGSITSHHGWTGDEDEGDD